MGNSQAPDHLCKRGGYLCERGGHLCKRGGYLYERGGYLCKSADREAECASDIG